MSSNEPETRGVQIFGIEIVNSVSLWVTVLTDYD